MVWYMRRCICILFIMMLFSNVNAKPIKVYYIRDVAKRAQDILIDFDGNGEINCVDKAVAFKLVWDKTYRFTRCELVRNYNPAMDFSHLFVRIRLLGMWYCIEPSYNPNRLTCVMSDVWGDRYDPAYNRYGETDYWLRKCGVK